MRRKIEKITEKRSKNLMQCNNRLLSGAETVKVCLYRSNAKRMIENKNNEIEKEEKRLRNCQVSVYGLAGGMQILKRFLILAVGVYLIYRNIIKVGDFW